MMVLFTTAVASQAQEVVITFPEYGASNIAIDAKITMQVNEPFIFDTTSLPLEWTNDSLEDFRCKFWFVDEEYYSGTDSSLVVSSLMGGVGRVDSLNPNLQEITIFNIQDFYYKTNYGLNIRGIKLINTQTQQVIEIDSLILGLFATLPEPLMFESTSFQTIPVTCNDNFFIVHFNEQLDTFQTEQGPIVSLDTVSIVVDTLSDSLIVTFHPINSTLEYGNGNNELRVTLENNFADSILYYLNIHLSRLTGNENDDISFSFRSSSVAKVNVHGGPADDLKPVYDTTYYQIPGQKITLAVPTENEDYVFDRWICAENPMLLFGVADTLSEVEIQLTCENIRPELHFIPLYTKIPYDTLQMVFPRSSTGEIIGSFQATNALDSLNDSTFIFKKGTDFSVCYNCPDTTRFSNWIVNDDTTVISSKCITQSTLSAVGLIAGGISTWIPVVREDPPEPCSTMVITVRLKGTDDLEVPANIGGFIPILKIRHNSDDIGALTFIPDNQYPGDNKRAIATLEIPNLDWSNIAFGFSVAIEGTLPYQYEFLSCSYQQGAQSYGSNTMKGSLSRILEIEDPSDQYTRFDLAYIDQSIGCNHDFEIIIRPRRVYLEVNEKMKNDGEYLPNESIAKVIVTPYEEPKKRDHQNEILSSQLVSRQKTYEFIYGQSATLYPKIEPNNGYDFYQWSPSDPRDEEKEFVSSPVSNTPEPNTLGPILMNGDKNVLLVLQSEFILESITITNDVTNREDEFDSGVWNGAFTPTFEDGSPAALKLSTYTGLYHPTAPDNMLQYTGYITFNFNRSLDINRFNKSSILISDDLLVGENGTRLDGLKSQLYALSNNIGGNFNFVNNGMIENGSIQVRVDNGYLTPPNMSFLKIQVLNEGIYDIEGNNLTNTFNKYLPTSYPGLKAVIDTIKSIDLEECGPCTLPFPPIWCLLENGNEVYGFMWLGYKVASNREGEVTSFQNNTNNGMRVPSFGHYQVKCIPHFEYPSINVDFINKLNPGGIVGVSALFKDADCEQEGSWGTLEKAGEILKNATDLLSPANSKYWDLIPQVLSLAISNVKPVDGCNEDEDETLFSDGFKIDRGGMFGNIINNQGKLYQKINRKMSSKYMNIYFKYQCFYFLN